MESYIVFVLLWVVYFFMHSWLISDSIKKFFSQALKDNYRYYRLAYNVFSTITLLLVLLYGATIETKMLVASSSFLKYLGLMIATFGLIIGKKGFKHYDTGEFLGFKQVKNNTAHKNELKTNGILNYVRHPLYAATILMVLGFWLFSPSITNLITFACIVIYLFVGIYLEEKKLIKEFGEDYIRYRKKVPMLVPHIRF